MSQTRYRLIFGLLGLALAAIVIGTVVLMPSGRAPGLPTSVESFSPADGATVLRQTRVMIDLEAGYEIELVIDETAIPTDEIDVTEATGVFVWEPGPGKILEEWVPGFHTVEASWDRAVGLPDPGSLRWSFRVQ